MFAAVHPALPVNNQDVEVERLKIQLEIEKLKSASMESMERVAQMKEATKISLANIQNASKERVANIQNASKERMANIQERVKAEENASKERMEKIKADTKIVVSKIGNETKLQIDNNKKKSAEVKTLIERFLDFNV